MIPGYNKSITGRALFRLFGTKWLAAPNLWLAALIYGTLGLLLAVVAGFGKPLLSLLLDALLFAPLLYLTNIVHLIGHLLAGALAGAPVDAVLLTAAWHRTLYREAPQMASRGARLYRTLGGPVLNLVFGVVLMGWWLLFSYTWLGALAWGNLLAGGIALLPLPNFDGGRAWRLLFSPRR